MSNVGKDYHESLAGRLKLRPKTGHGPSRVPFGKYEGLQLKKPYHPTFKKAIKTDKAMGGQFYRKGGKLYSFGSEGPPSEAYKLVPYKKLYQKVRSAQERHKQRTRGPKPQVKKGK